MRRGAVALVSFAFILLSSAAASAEVILWSDSRVSLAIVLDRDTRTRSWTLANGRGETQTVSFDSIVAVSVSDFEGLMIEMHRRSRLLDAYLFRVGAYPSAGTAWRTVEEELTRGGEAVPRAPYTGPWEEAVFEMKEDPVDVTQRVLEYRVGSKTVVSYETRTEALTLFGTTFPPREGTR